MARYRETHDLEDLAELYERYMDLVYGVCLKYFKEPEDAKDAVINIFEELIEKLLKYEVAHFKGWLHRLTTNHCLMQLRSNRSKPVKVDADIVYLKENTHPDSVMEKEMVLTGMEKCLEQLPSEQRRAVELFYLKEQSYKEIAESLELEVGKVRSFIQNGRRNLKICMEKKGMETTNQ